MDKSITEKFSVVKSRAQSIKLSRVWFEWFLDLINAGWHRQYTFLGETHTFASLSEFVEHKDGLESDPIALYLAVEACSKNSNFLPYSKQLLELFHKEGFDPVIEKTPKVNNLGDNQHPKAQSEKRKSDVLQFRAQGLTQKEVAEKTGISQQRVAQIESTSGCYTITPTSTQEENDRECALLHVANARGTSSEYLTRRTKRDFPEEYEAGNVGKGKKYPTARALAIAKGAIKKPLTITFYETDDGELIFQKLSRRLSDEQLFQLKTYLEDTTNA